MSSEAQDLPQERPVTPTNHVEIFSADKEVSLREYVIEDAEEAFALIARNREHLSQYGEDTPSKYPDVESFRNRIFHPDPEKPGRLRFAIRNREGVIVGSINLTPQKEDQRRGEIGYYLGAEFQRHGYINRAIGTLTKYAFDELGYRVLFGNVHPDNERSMRALRGNGYSITGRNQKGGIVLTKEKPA